MMDIDSLNKTNLNFIEIEKILSIKITNHTRICSLLNSNRNYIFFKLILVIQIGYPDWFSKYS